MAENPGLTLSQNIGRMLMPVRESIYPPVILFFFFSKLWQYDNPALLQPLGGVLVAAGVAWRGWGVFYIGGKAHTTSGKRLDRFVTRGPFAWHRNPLYFANATVLGGLGLLALLPWAAAAAVTLTTLIYHFVVLYEETLMAESFGDEYLRYKKVVPRWMPGFRKLDGFEPVEPRKFGRVLYLESGGLIGLAVALALMAVKHFVDVRFSVEWAVGLAGALAAFIIGHLVHLRLKANQKKKKNDRP